MTSGCGLAAMVWSWPEGWWGLLLWPLRIVGGLVVLALLAVLLLPVLGGLGAAWRRLTRRDHR